jgi:hypothetical protein
MKDKIINIEINNEDKYKKNNKKLINIKEENKIIK